MSPPLVDYSSSDEGEQPGEDDNRHKAKKKKYEQEHDNDEHHENKVKIPRLPESFYSIYPCNSSTNNTATSGNGKSKEVAHDDSDTPIRSIPHMEGKWPCHVYLEWCPSSEIVHQLDGYVRELAKLNPTIKLRNHVMSGLQVELPLHISLSETLMVDTQDKDKFVDSCIHELMSVVRDSRRDGNGRGHSSPLGDAGSTQSSLAVQLDVNNIELLSNKPNTRHFIAIGLATGLDCPILVRLISAMNKIGNRFAYKDQILSPTLDEHNPHVTIASFVEKKKMTASNDDTAAANKKNIYSSIQFPDISLSLLTAHLVSFSHVKIRVGRIVHAAGFSGQ